MKETMSVEVDTKVMTCVLRTVIHAVPKKTRLPILQHVLLKGDGKQLSVTGANLGMALTMTCKAKVVRAGAVCVRPQRILELLNRSQQKVTRLSVKNKHMAIAAGPMSVSLPTESATDFPAVPGIPETKGVMVRSLSRSLHQASYAMSGDDSRHVLHGVLLHVAKGKMEAIAADGFRMAVTRINTGKNAGDERHAIVPYEVVRLVEKLDLQDALVFLPADMPPVPTDVSQVRQVPHVRTVAIVGKGMTLMFSPIEGKYPDYTKLIPTCGGRATSFRTSDMVAALKLIGNKKAVIKLKTTAGKMSVEGKDIDDSVASLSIPAKGARFTMGFTSAYLMDAMALMPEMTKMRLTDPRSPVRLDSYNTVHVLMPCHLGKEGVNDKKETSTTSNNGRG